ncbi:MAG: hypothetical protein LW650_11745 [Planctomycetaceae bacterium]|jgi:hypothetical protein|nr:hypothetical protein [Phycisphaerales bacterium]MCE2654102.1 hypothetical protein [Planctomycetaceae bacterium]
MPEPIDVLIADWTRLGCLFNTVASPATPDVERLLLRTAMLAPDEPRVFVMAVTWLGRFAELVARHRLRRLVLAELAIEHRPALAVLLATAQERTRPPLFASILRELEPAADPGPLFAVERLSPALIQRCRERATRVSLEWGRWCEEAPPKADALRPDRWVMSHNPELLARADFRGDVRASILAALAHDTGKAQGGGAVALLSAGASEVHLARCAGASRAQVRAALDNLELTGRVVRRRAPGVRAVRVEMGSDGYVERRSA